MLIFGFALYLQHVHASCSYRDAVDFEEEMQAGQLSVIDYVTVLRNRIGVQRDHMLLQTNRQLLVTAWNYWNW